MEHIYVCKVIKNDNCVKRKQSQHISQNFIYIIQSI